MARTEEGVLERAFSIKNKIDLYTLLFHNIISTHSRFVSVVTPCIDNICNKILWHCIWNRNKILWHKCYKKKEIYMQIFFASVMVWEAYKIHKVFSVIKSALAEISSEYEGLQCFCSNYGRPSVDKHVKF